MFTWDLLPYIVGDVKMHGRHEYGIGGLILRGHLMISVNFRPFFSQSDPQTMPERRNNVTSEYMHTFFFMRSIVPQKRQRVMAKFPFLSPHLRFPCP